MHLCFTCALSGYDLCWLDWLDPEYGGNIDYGVLEPLKAGAMVNMHPCIL